MCCLRWQRPGGTCSYRAACGEGHGGDCEECRTRHRGDGETCCAQYGEGDTTSRTHGNQHIHAVSRGTLQARCATATPLRPQNAGVVGLMAASYGCR